MELTRGIAYTKSVSSSSRAVEAIVSSDTIDRHGDIIDQGSWRLDSYRRNPVVLFAHDYDQPIGRAESLDVQQGALHARIVFASTPKGEEVLTLFREGALRAFSVGFRVGSIQQEQTQDGRSVDRLLDCELWEISAVAVPANPDALAKHKSLGLVPPGYASNAASPLLDEINLRAAMSPDELANYETAKALRSAGL